MGIISERGSTAIWVLRMRIAEKTSGASRRWAKLFANAGIVTIASFITPKKELRTLAREVIREPDFREVFVTCSFETCEQRDVKGLYAKAKSGDIKHFTGKDSSFEPPDESSPADLELNTDEKSEHICLEELYSFAKNVLK